MIKNINALADRLKGVKVGEEELTPEKLLTILKDDKEIELTIAPVHLLGETELTELKTTVKKEGYNEGSKAGSEMFAKELKKAFGLNGDEYPGKDIESVKTILNNKILADAKIEPEKKVKELTESLTKLQTTFTEKEKEWNSTTSTLKEQIEQKEIDFYAQSNMPQVNGLKPSQALILYKQERQLKKDESGNIVIYKGGSILKDTMEKPISFTSDFTNWAKESGFLGSQGRGGGNEGGGVTSEFKTINDVMKYLETNKINPMSADGAAIIEKFNQSQKK